MNLTGIISVVFLSIYSVSTFIGIGSFRCDCTHSKRIVMLLMQPSCPCSSSPEKCCSHNDRYHHDEKDDNENDHEDNCCSLEYQYLDVDQLNIIQSLNHQAKVLLLHIIPFFTTNNLNLNIIEYADAVKNNSPPPTLLKIPLIYKHRQLRL